MQLSWLVLALATLIGVGSIVYVWWAGRTTPAKAPALPEHWALTARPVFSAAERQLLQRLQEALPQHTVLPKLPLVRLCQPLDPEQFRYWFDLIGGAYVTFAVATPGGRVLLALDLEHDRPGSRRAEKIKMSVLAACRVRHVKAHADNLPSIAEIKLMVPEAGATAPVHQQSMQRASATLAHTVRARRAERGPGVDSGFAHDSFFAMDHGRFESDPHSRPSALGRTSGLAPLSSTRGPADLSMPSLRTPARAEVQLDVSKVLESARESARALQ